MEEGVRKRSPMTNEYMGGLADSFRPMKVLVIITLPLVVLGCATTPTPTSEARPVPPSHLLAPEYFHRHSDSEVEVIVKRDQGFSSTRHWYNPSPRWQACRKARLWRDSSSLPAARSLLTWRHSHYKRWFTFASGRRRRSLFRDHHRYIAFIRAAAETWPFTFHARANDTQWPNHAMERTADRCTLHF